MIEDLNDTHLDAGSGRPPRKRARTVVAVFAAGLFAIVPCCCVVSGGVRSQRVAVGPSVREATVGRTTDRAADASP